MSKTSSRAKYIKENAVEVRDKLRRGELDQSTTDTILFNMVGSLASIVQELTEQLEKERYIKVKVI